ncbi:MAG: hypothetical protein A3E36_03820 [Candidatus Andersenbacteria bacterium RIFCSPHIGHO2_12_FULL_45_11b]|uniref:Uncharacterized protein n=1 Tax=Candidatus Andersenbacteria bacterium RIFCSPHIGHO2_12_FULL_45_11b TaxID=1797282 RepID=A0A1G1XB25_9BACT|nr:MAG: hypothetical protein A3E36_03820 [Candidatus Andersenbacteria bacterium RIFCSPHIGHO2_12_FULL_45_11b]
MNVASSNRLARVYWDVENTHDTSKIRFFHQGVRGFLIDLGKFLRGQQVEMERQSRVYLRQLRIHLPDWKNEASKIFSQGGFRTLWPTYDAETRLVQDIHMAIEHAKNAKIQCTYPLPQLVIIISGDRDVIHAVKELQFSGREVWIISVRSRLSSELRRTANQCFVSNRGVIFDVNARCV